MGAMAEPEAELRTYGGALRPGDPRDVPCAQDEYERTNMPPVVPHFRSRYGGLWTDLSTAHDILTGKRQLGLVSEEEEARLRTWIDEGYVILEGAVPHAVIDEALDELRRTLEHDLPPRKAEWWSESGKHFGVAGSDTMTFHAAKLLDLHLTSPATQRMIYHAPLARFLKLIFERPPLAFQSLSMVQGTRQPVHADTAFVRVSSALEFAACWIALEDITPDSGELEYYPGSHALEEQLFDGRYKWVPEDTTVVPDYSERLHAAAQGAGLELKRFLPKKGDALFWAADLFHGGRDHVAEGKTRRSHVTHFCPLDRAPMYMVRDPSIPKHETVNGGWVCGDRWT